MANKATPTSAITAAHIVANPTVPKIKTKILTPKAKEMFCQIIFLAATPIAIAVATLEG